MDEVGYSNVTKTESRRDEVWDAADTGREMCLHPHRVLRDIEFYEYKISNNSHFLLRYLPRVSLSLRFSAISSILLSVLR